MSALAKTRPELWREKGYRNGSILRIKMVNFLTYDECEVFPGPKLNVVIGPNGTGKSSISAAICLALCGDPKLIGRSDDLSTFVNSKSDLDEAYIEVDLLRQDSITTIRRSFCKTKSKKGRKTNTSYFFVDGEVKKLPDVQQLIRSLNINFDNLITYMPQDRVGEFTTLDAKKLLSETLRAVENPDGDGTTMKDEMDELIRLQNEQMQEAGHERTIQRNVDQLRNELAVMQPSVDRMREREEVKRRIRLYEIKLEHLTFQHTKEKHGAAKSELNLLQQEMNDVEARLDGLRVEHREAEVRLKRVGQAQKQVQRQIATRCEEAAVAAEKCETFSQKRISAVSEMNSILTERQRLETKLQNARQHLARMEAELAQEAAHEAGWQQNIANLRAQLQDLITQDQEFEGPIGQQRRELQELVDQEQRINRRLASLTDWKSVARNHLSHDKLGSEAIQVLDWIEHNRHRLPGEVRGPILMELTIPDDFVAAVVDKVLPKGTQTAFVVETQEALTMLRDEFRTRRRFGVNFYKINNLAAPERKVPAETLSSPGLGQAQYLDVLLDCPPIVKAQLTSFSNVHNIILARNSFEAISSDTLRQLVQHTNTGILYHQNVNTGHITNYSIRRSRYNLTGAPSTMKVEIPPARFKRQDQSAGPDRETLTQQLQDCRGQITQLRGRVEAAARRHEQIRGDIRAIKNEMANIQQSIQALRKKRNEVERQKSQIADLVRQQERDFQKEAEEQKAEVKQAVRQHLQALRAWKEAVDACAQLMITAQSKNIEYSLVTAIFKRLNDGLMDSEEILTDYRRRMQQRKDEIAALEREIRRLTDRLKGEMAPADDEEYTEILALDVVGETSVEKMDDARQRIENYKQQLRQTRENNEVLERYARVQVQLQETEAQLADLQGRLNNARGEMQERLTQFTDAVETLATKLSTEFQEYMEGMGAGGEIVLVTDDGEGEHRVRRPIKDWEMQPHVRFRKGHGLSALSGMRNSGGERAVSTIMYLMALQDLSSAPVRIVDEINQGMDERNERLVFERIVSCTKQSQYFYISPKLLQALTSMEDDDVTVLLVLNGPGLRMRHQLPYYLKLMTGDAKHARDAEAPSHSKRARLRFAEDSEGEDDDTTRSSNGRGERRSPKRPLQLGNGDEEEVDMQRRRV